ncbi:MAG: class I SAM-dependent methyltransferase [Desulfosarcinaceae bacterium]
MASVEEHYKQLLAPYYSWSQGGAERQQSRFRAFFDKYAAHPAGCGVALDLGAGSGFQSIPLAERGFQVIAIDINRELLDELHQRAGDLSIVAVQDDLLDFAHHCSGQAELIVCMGDTLTHLRSLHDVRRLIESANRELAVGGRLFLSFRDMSVAAVDLERFIPVRSDANRIFTCFLEYEKRQVKVHDLVYEWCQDRWILQKSYYRKLRISTDWLHGQIEKVGLGIDDLDVQNGMTTLIARKA